jgi:hypothetical protein
MITAGDHYTALLDSTTLLLVRDGQPLELPTRIEGEYELALSAAGVLAVADFGGATWLVRPGGSRLEPGPPHSGRPMSVAAAGRFAAWGYTDGVVIAVDTKSGEVWRFFGHGYPVVHLAIDERNARAISASTEEIRVWSLAPDPMIQIDRTRCTALSVAPSPDHTRALLDCDDGSVRVWSFASGKLHEVHRHRDVAYGVAWLRDVACSAGFDGRVLCTGPDGTTREILSAPGAIRRLAASPDHARIVILTGDGQVREFDGALHPLFAHDAEPYQVAFSPDGRWLASGAMDGSVVVWDVSQRRVRSRTQAHAGWVTSLGWRGGELWTASGDGTVKRWRNDEGTLKVADTRRDQGSIRFLHLLPDGWIANAGGRELIVERAPPAMGFRLDLDRNLQRLGPSRDGRYIVAVTAGEIVVIDQAELAVASLPIATSGIGYVGFIDRDTLAISKLDGLVTVPLAALAFERFVPHPPGN